jgi:hypothetical protein
MDVDRIVEERRLLGAGLVGDPIQRMESAIGESVRGLGLKKSRLKD